jgi:glycosyltransferase involved in cell wall biosynthesis
MTAAMFPIGTWYRAHHIAAALGRRGHSVTFLMGSTDRVRLRREAADGVVTWRIPQLWGASRLNNGTRMPWDVAARIAVEIAGRYDVIHAFTHHFNCLFPAVVARWTPIPSLVIGDRDDLWADGGLYGDGSNGSRLRRLDYQFHSWTERNMGPWLGTMTVVSEALKDRVIAEGVSPERVRKIINGCPTRSIVPGDRAVARKNVGLPPHRRIFLFVGVGQYDVDLILDSLQLLRPKFTGDAFPLTFLVGPHAARLRNMAAERGLGDVVTATGELSGPSLVPYLQAADVGLLPFADKPLNWARFPIKIGDYLAAGLPILTNDVGEMARIVRESASGEVTAPDPKSYASGMVRMLTNPTSLSTYAAHATAAAERLSWDAVGREVEQFYLDMSADG